MYWVILFSIYFNLCPENASVALYKYIYLIWLKHKQKGLVCLVSLLIFVCFEPTNLLRDSAVASQNPFWQIERHTYRHTVPCFMLCLKGSNMIGIPRVLGKCQSTVEFFWKADDVHCLEGLYTLCKFAILVNFERKKWTKLNPANAPSR